MIDHTVEWLLLGGLILISLGTIIAVALAMGGEREPPNPSCANGCCDV